MLKATVREISRLAQTMQSTLLYPCNALASKLCGYWYAFENLKTVEETVRPRKCQTSVPAAIKRSARMSQTRVCDYRVCLSHWRITTCPHHLRARDAEGVGAASQRVFELEEARGRIRGSLFACAPRVIPLADLSGGFPSDNDTKYCREGVS